MIKTTGVVSSACAGPSISLSSTSVTTNQTLQTGNEITNIVYTYGGTATSFEVVYKANGTTVSKPSWLSATTSGSTITFSGTPNNTTTTTYSITINSTDGTDDSDALTATIAAVVPSPATLVLTSGTASQTAYTGSAISTVVYTYGGGAMGATVTGLPNWSYS